MAEFPILTKRIRELWGYFAEIENILYIGPSETPEIAVENIKREIIKLQSYAKALHEHNQPPNPAFLQSPIRRTRFCPAAKK